MRHVYNKDYEILKFDTNSLPGTYLKKPFLIKINNIKIVNKVFFSLLIIIQGLINKPKLIIVTHIHYAPIIYLLNKLIRIPYIVIAHGIEIIPQMTLSKLSKLRILSIKKANKILAVSDWTKDHLVNLKIDNSKIGILPNTFDSSQFFIDDKKKYLLDRYSINKNEKIILTVSRIDRREGYKGHEKILQSIPMVINKIGQVKYLIVGKNNDEFKIKRLIKKYKLDNNVVLCGFVPKEEIKDHYNISDLFVMTSYGEGFGIVFLESLGCGVPVIDNTDGTMNTLKYGRVT